MPKRRRENGPSTSGNARSTWIEINPSTTSSAAGEAISQNRPASASISRPVMAMPPVNT